MAIGEDGEEGGKGSKGIPVLFHRAESLASRASDDS